jgi:transposase
MSKQDRFTDEFKQEAVAQVVERGHAASEVADQLGISTKSLNTWKALFSQPLTVRNSEADLAAELRRVKKEMVRATEEGDELKNRHGSQPACARYKQPVLPSVVWRAVADRLLEGQTPLKNVAHGLMRT